MWWKINYVSKVEGELKKVYFGQLSQMILYSRISHTDAQIFIISLKIIIGLFPRFGAGLTYWSAVTSVSGVFVGFLTTDAISEAAT